MFPTNTSRPRVNKTGRSVVQSIFGQTGRMRRLKMREKLPASLECHIRCIRSSTPILPQYGIANTKNA